jgi:hypothetical protein
MSEIGSEVVMYVLGSGSVKFEGMKFMKEMDAGF